MAALGNIHGLTLTSGLFCRPSSVFINTTTTTTPPPHGSYYPSTTKNYLNLLHPHSVASLSATTTNNSSTSSVTSPPRSTSTSINQLVIPEGEGEGEGEGKGKGEGEGKGGGGGGGGQTATRRISSIPGFQEERLSDYFQVSQELVIRSNADRGPPRWFSYFPVAAAPATATPLLLFLPGLNGVGSGLLLQMDGLSEMFEVWCLHIPMMDRTPFSELVKLVEERLRCESSRRRGRGPPIYLVGESFGGCLALAVASRNPHLHLLLILANPATCFPKSHLYSLLPFSQMVLPVPAQQYRIHSINLALLYVLTFASGFPWRLAVDAIRRGLSPQQTFVDLAEGNAALSSYLSVLAELLTPETLNWKLMMLKSAAEFANSRLHAVKARTLILSSGRDPLLPSEEEGERLRRMLPNCEIRMFRNRGHVLFLEDGFDLATVIKGASFYQRERRLDYVSDYLPPKASEFNRIYEPHRWTEVACNPVMLSTLEDGKIVRGLSGIPCEGPVLFVGYHMLLGFELIPLVAGFWREKGIVLRGIAHPMAFKKLKDGKLPDLSTYDAFRSMGAVPVSATNFFKLFSSKSHVLLYPGGLREALHRKGEEHKLIWPQQSEFVRMAARFGAKIVPFGAVGEDDFGQLIFDYEDLMKIPYFKSAIEELTEEADRLRSDVKGEVGNQDIHLPIILPKLLPGRLYFSFGKPIDTQGMHAGSSRRKQEDQLKRSREAADELYREVKTEVEKQMAYLKERRERDPYRNILSRLTYQAIHGFHSQVPTFDLDDRY